MSHQNTFYVFYDNMVIGKVSGNKLKFASNSAFFLILIKLNKIFTTDDIDINFSLFNKMTEKSYYYNAKRKMLDVPLILNIGNSPLFYKIDIEINLLEDNKEDEFVENISTIDEYCIKLII